MIEIWLAKKTIQIIVVCLALLGVVTAPIAIWDHFEIVGANVLWWHIDGLRDAAASTQTAIGNLKTCQANEAKYKKAIDHQNVSMAKLNADYLALQAQAAKNKTAADIADKKAAAEAAEILASKAVGEHCKAALDLIHKESAP
jgi:hypothetical protein